MMQMNTSVGQVSRKRFTAAVLFLAFLLLSCGGAGQGSATNTAVWTIEQILSQNQSREILPQTVEVRHCGVPEPQYVECAAGAAAQFTYDLAATDYSPAALHPGIKEALGVDAGVINRLELPLPPQGVIGRYKLRQQFSLLRGEAFARSVDNAQKNLSYTFITACTIEVESETLLDCETEQEIKPPTAQAAATGTATATPGIATAEATSTSPTLIPSSSPSPFPSPSPTLTATPISMGQNCTTPPGATFAELWASYNTILGCPRSEATVISLLAEEAFQGGHLFWRNDTDQVYIIFDRRKSDGLELFEGVWELNPNELRWDGSDPEGIGLNPPSGLAEPKRGFGWLWRNHLGRAEGPLGWALDREYGFENVAQAQIFEQGLMFKGSTAKIYVLGNDGHFFSR